MAQNVFLQCVAAGVIKGGLKILSAGVPFGPVLLEIGTEAWNRWQAQKKADQRLVELEQVARLTAKQMNQQIQQILRDQAADRSEQEQQALAAYLRGVQATVRRNLRHPSDPSGTTIPPGLLLNNAKQLVDYLPDRPSRFQAGQPIPGQTHWILQEQLGVGGFGEVWLAENPSMPKPTAFKFCLDPKLLASLHNEMKQLRRLLAEGRQDGIVEMQDVNLNNDPAFIRFEYVPGGELTSLIESWHRQQGGPKPEQAAKVIWRLAQIVSHFHRLDPPLVHRDLKPANILVQMDQKKKYQFKIADFGIGAAVAQSSVEQAMKSGGSRGSQYTVSGSFTPIYASPEQMRGEKADPRDDVHALGVIWYQMLTGDLQHEVPRDWQEELQARQIQLTEPMQEILKSCLSGRAERRPASATVLAASLESLLKSPSEFWPPVIVAFAFIAPCFILISLFGLLRTPAEIKQTQQATPTEIEQTRRATPTEIQETHQAGTELVIGTLGIKMCYCPAGSFTMGSPTTEGGRGFNEAQVSVTLREGFWIGKYEVTQEQYEQVMGNNPSYDKSNPQNPVVYVSYNDALDFCRRLTERERRGGTLPTGWEFTLPTEAQWEYACRAGSTTAYCYGDGESQLGLYAWYSGNSGNETHPLGQKRENGWGIHDMHGNVWEWCLDWYAYKLAGGPATGSYRVNRGGSCSRDAQCARSASRGGLQPGFRSNYLGFRLVLVPAP